MTGFFIADPIDEQADIAVACARDNAAMERECDCRVDGEPCSRGVPMAGRRITLRVLPPAPLGDFTLVPATLSGRPESDLARTMAAALAEGEAPTAAEALKRLRQAFPRAPLSARLAGLAAIMGRMRPPV
jgi:hypothetical protein